MLKKSVNSSYLTNYVGSGVVNVCILFHLRIEGEFYLKRLKTFWRFEDNNFKNDHTFESIMQEDLRELFFQKVS